MFIYNLFQTNTLHETIRILQTSLQKIFVSTLNNTKIQNYQSFSGCELQKL